MRFSSTSLAFGLVGSALADPGTVSTARTLTAPDTAAGVSFDPFQTTVTSGLGNFEDVHVTTSVCFDPSLTIQVSPADEWLSSDGTATFKETVSLTSSLAPGIHNCIVTLQLNGSAGGEAFTHTIRGTIFDVTAPTVSCVAGANPAGSKKPGTDANFWTLISNDNGGENLMIWVLDSVSGTDLGLYPSGTSTKLV
jgi:hypothetical protein